MHGKGDEALFSSLWGSLSRLSTVCLEKGQAACAGNMLPFWDA